MMWSWVWRSVPLSVLCVVPLALALEIPTYLEGRTIVGSNWASTMEIANGSAVLLAILSLVAGASVGVLTSRSGRMLSGLPVRSALAALVPGLASGLLVTVVHLCWVMVVVVLGRNATGPFSPVTVLPPLVAILVAGPTGALVGGALGSWLAPPFLGLISSIVLITVDGAAENLVNLGGIGLELTALQVRPAVVWSQVAWFVAIGVATTMLAVGRHAGTRATAVAVAGAAVLLGVGASSVLAQGAGRFELGATEWVCAGADVRFCVLSEDEAVFDDGRDQLQEAARRWAEIDPRGLGVTYWQRLDIPVPGHEREFSLRETYLDEEAAEVIITSSFDCAQSWDYDAFRLMQRTSLALVGEGLSTASAAWQPRRVRAALSGLSC